MSQQTHNGNGNGNWGSTLDFFRGLAFGGLAGATLALLFAPRSGEATRELILEKGDELRDRASQTAFEMREQIAGLTHRVQGQAEELADEVASGAGELQQRSRDYVLDRKERIERTAKAAKQAVQETWSEAA